MDKIGPISEVRAHLPEVINWIQRSNQRYLVTRQGKAVAVIVSPDALEALEIRAGTEWKKYQRSWKAYDQWQTEENLSPDQNQTIRDVGERVDFFLKRHRKRSKDINVEGLRRMRERLSKLK